MTPMIVVSAPSGAGKSSFCSRIVEEYPDRIVDSVSFTTRQPRDSEVDGNPYFFVTRDKFQELVQKNFFIEWAEVFGNFYGTPRYQLEDAKKEGKFLIMDVDVQGAASFRKLFPDAVYVFILPPSIDELRRRLEKRDKGRTANLEQRLETASREISQAGAFDHQIMNDDFDKAFHGFKKIIEELFKQG